ncbi:hypothetical protein EXIGLDRAFT_97710 [Exidia glandulosa HHB12029]|uniref:PIG-F-domain-containing protein n=1 Tax=Exidia glandulosa HHB12029 TaxID=1314781 RepID=A0A165H238_EXIGL|nr:hypothetical protein EXIGLDRAFT_97710 [Exidia glandulosa HHB12029]
MPSKKKSKSTSATAQPPAPGPSADRAKQLEHAALKYASRLTVHVSLLAFTALFLPRSTTFFVNLPAPQTSLDRPEPTFIQPLSASPLLTTAWLCVGASVLVTVWAAPMRTWVFYEQPGKRTDEQVARWAEGRRKSARDAFLATSTGAGAYYLLLTALGAPLAMYHVRTALLAVLLSILTVSTPAYALGVPTIRQTTAFDAVRFRWTRLFCDFMLQTDAERAMFYPSAGAVLGAWAGAFPIALDWDRPWQAWPLTPAFGAVLGYIVGSLVALAFIALPSSATSRQQRSSMRTD